MLNTYIENRLIAWAYWSNKKEDGGLGYPRHVSFVNNTPKSTSSEDDYMPIDVIEVMEIEKCVMALKRLNIDLFDAVWHCYRELNMTVEQKYKKLKIAKQTYYNRIDSAHRHILDLLHDL